MPTLMIHLTKRADDDVVLRCDRTDNTFTWQRQQGRNAGFFAAHDLTHYSVESVLACRRGFFGLIADGWDIADTEGKGPRGPLPRETIAVEHMVGFLDVERASRAVSTAAEWMEHATLAGVDLACIAGRAITDGDLAAIRARRAELFDRWSRLESGAGLTLPFPG